jgi:glycine cleavage system H lipoate-binding protein
MKTVSSDRKTGIQAPVCIWTQAGIAEREPCEADFDCNSCDFDRQMRRKALANQKTRAADRVPKGKDAGIVFWKDRLRERPAGQRPCRHHMTGRIDFRTCTNDYQCLSCSFDQYFFDQYSVHAVLKPVDVLDVEGIKLPQGYYFHRGHTWIRIEQGAEVRVGIDDFAYHLLGVPDRIETPLIGKTVAQGEPAVDFIRGDKVARLQSPISGVVTATHSALREDGKAAYRNPYTEGWLMGVHATDLRRDLKNLLLGGEIRAVWQQEVDQLFTMIDTDIRPLAADGGQLYRDLYGGFPEIGWERLVQTFLT